MTAAAMTKNSQNSKPTLLATLNRQSLQPLSDNLKLSIWQVLVDPQAKHSDIDRRKMAYFAYYVGLCETAMDNQGQYCSARNHQDILNVVSDIYAEKSLDEILARLRDGRDPPQGSIAGKSDTQVRGTVSLAAQVVCMHRVGDMSNVASGKNRIFWENGTLQSSLAKYHEHASGSRDELRLGPLFNIVNLELIANFNVIWTDNLADHLRFRDPRPGERAEISIFHHASYLKAMSDRNSENLFPKGFLEETLNTLALLFPYKDRDVKKWFDRKLARISTGLQEIDYEVLACARSNMHKELSSEDFKYWRERLSIIAHALDIAEPATLRQWWTDRRHRVQWATFWVAILVLILTIVFGIIQSVEGAMQVYIAYHPQQH